MKGKTFISDSRIEGLLGLSPNACKIYLHIIYYSTGLIPVCETSSSKISSLLDMQEDEVKKSVKELLVAKYIVLHKKEDNTSIAICNLNDDLVALSSKRQFLYQIRGQVNRLGIIDPVVSENDKGWNDYITKLKLLFPKV